MKRNSKKRAQQTAAKPTAADLIDIENFAASIQWHPESLRRACRQGRVAAIKLGRGWRISKEVAEGIIKNGIPAPF